MLKGSRSGFVSIFLLTSLSLSHTRLVSGRKYLTWPPNMRAPIRRCVRHKERALRKSSLELLTFLAEYEEETSHEVEEQKIINHFIKKKTFN